MKMGARRSSGGGMSDLPYWILALVFLFAFPPVGVLMIALRLFGGGSAAWLPVAILLYAADGQAPWGWTTVSEPSSQERPAEGEKAPGRKAEQDMSPVCLDVVEKMAKRGRKADPGGRDHYGGLRLHGAGLRRWAMRPTGHGDAIWFWDQLLNAIPLCFLGGGAACCGPACGKSSRCAPTETIWP